MHDCSGLGPSSSHAPERWAQELSGRGYVVLIPDSFTTRGFPNGVCTNPAPTRVDVAPGRADSIREVAVFFGQHLGTPASAAPAKAR